MTEVLGVTLERLYALETRVVVSIVLIVLLALAQYNAAWLKRVLSKPSPAMAMPIIEITDSAAPTAVKRSRFKKPLADISAWATSSYTTEQPGYDAADAVIPNSSDAEIDGSTEFIRQAMLRKLYNNYEAEDGDETGMISELAAAIDNMSTQEIQEWYKENPTELDN